MKTSLRDKIYSYKSALYVDWKDIDSDYKLSKYDLFKDYMTNSNIYNEIFKKEYSCIYIKNYKREDSIENFKKFFSVLFYKAIEITVENDLHETSEDYIDKLHSAGVNRISLNVYDNDTQNYDKSFDKIKHIKSLSIKLDISIIFSTKSYEEELLKFIDICSMKNVNHISLYQTDDDYDDSLNYIFNSLRNRVIKLNYENYETKHFSKNGEYSLISFIYSCLLNWDSIGTNGKGFSVEKNRMWILSNREDNISANDREHFDISEAKILLISNLWTNVLGLNINLWHHKAALDSVQEEIDYLLKSNYLNIDGNHIYANNLISSNTIEDALSKT